MRILGFDIGGVNTKSALIDGQADGTYSVVDLHSVPFSFRKHGSDLDEALGQLLRQATIPLGGGALEAWGVTLTAESVGIFPTLAAGVERILRIVERAAAGVPVYAISVEGTAVPLERALCTPLQIASANWAGTARLVGQRIGEGLLVDVGSTTTDIIPIRAGRPAARGHTDLARLAGGELVYSGMLRTYIQSITHRLPLNGGWARLSSEIRCLSADVHVLLGHLPEMSMPHPFSGLALHITPDNALSKLARSVCADTEMLTPPQLRAMAAHVYDQQVESICQAILQVLEAQKMSPDSIRGAVTGLGYQHLAAPALTRAGVRDIVELGSSDQENEVATAVAAAVLTWEEVRSR